MLADITIFLPPISETQTEYLGPNFSTAQVCLLQPFGEQTNGRLLCVSFVLCSLSAFQSK